EFTCCACSSCEAGAPFLSSGWPNRPRARGGRASPSLPAPLSPRTPCFTSKTPDSPSRKQKNWKPRHLRQLRRRDRLAAPFIQGFFKSLPTLFPTNPGAGPPPPPIKRTLQEGQMGNASHAIRNLALTAALLLATVPVGLGGKVQSAEGRQSIIVELSGLPPSVVAAEQARKQGKAFDRAAHDRAVIGSQQT